MGKQTSTGVKLWAVGSPATEDKAGYEALMGVVADVVDLPSYGPTCSSRIKAISPTVIEENIRAFSN